MIYESVLLGLQRATHATLHRLAAALPDMDLTASEIGVLANLANGHPRTVSQLAAATGVKPSTMSSVLDRLAARGLTVRCMEVGGDRRVVLISLTDAGETAAKTIRKTLANVEQQALRDLPREALTGFQQALHALTKVDHE